MSNAVFANMMEVSCKAGSGKTICAFPDVCFTPPQTPPTPMGVPIPYPNTGMSSDCTDGSSTVKIGGQEVMLKDKSCFKQSTGDEAGATPKKGVITSKTKGKVYFNAWSMDVKIEGENVVRHLDLTTHNHASKPGQTPPMPETEGMSGGLPPMDISCKGKVRENGEPWSKCDYKQYCKKVEKLNRQAKGGRHKRAYDSKRSAKKLKREKRNAQRRHRAACNRQFNDGSKTQAQVKRQFAHPCAYKEWKQEGSLDGFQPDHTHEVQLGGHPSSPANFKWMRSHVNASIGSTLQNYDPKKSCGVTADCCPA